MKLPNISEFKTYNNTSLIEKLNLKKINPLDMNVNLLSDKDKVKAYKQVEKIIRSSIEYKDYIDYLKKNMDMNRCSFFNNVEMSKRVKIEMHHSPLSLFDIVSIVATKQMHEDGDFNYFMIAKEVMELHYRCEVGLIPLSSTMHTLVHLGQVFIPLDAPYGNYIKFLKKYDKYINQDLLSMLEEAFILSKQVQDLSLLETKYTYIEAEGFKLPQLL